MPTPRADPQMNTGGRSVSAPPVSCGVLVLQSTGTNLFASVAFTWISKALDRMLDMQVWHILLGTDQIPVIDKVIGSMGVLESDVEMFPSQATNGLGGLDNIHVLLWAIGFLSINQG